MRERLTAIVTATAPPLPEPPEPGAPATARRAYLWRRLQHGWPARYPLAQFPNAPLLLSLLAGQLAKLAGTSAAHYLEAASAVLLGVWAWLELAGGVNLARRLIGAGGLAFVLAALGERLG